MSEMLEIKGYVITLISDISNMNTVYKVHFTLYYVSLMCIHVGDVGDVKYLNKTSKAM